ncbi:MAG: hypothetical protein ABI778_11290, partial [Ignavibacteriota bacterium]
MKKVKISLNLVFLFALLASSSSCNRPEGKDGAKGDPSNFGVSDSGASKASNPQTVVPNPSPSGSQAMEDDEYSDQVQLIPTPNIVIPDYVPRPGAQPPIGSLPMLRAEQLVAFHPRLPEYFMVSPKIHEEPNKEVQSIILFRNKNDSLNTIRSTV